MAHGVTSQILCILLLLLNLIRCPGCVGATPPPPPATGYYQGFLEKVLLSPLLAGCDRLSSLARLAYSDTHMCLQIYVNYTTVPTPTFYPDFPNLTPNYTFLIPYVNSSTLPGLWSMNVRLLHHDVLPLAMSRKSHG